MSINKITDNITAHEPVVDEFSVNRKFSLTVWFNEELPKELDEAIPNEYTLNKAKRVISDAIYGDVRYKLIDILGRLDALRSINYHSNSVLNQTKDDLSNLITEISF